MYKKILLATELSTYSHELALKAMTLAEQLNAELYLIHVIEVPQGTLYAASIGLTEYLNPITDNAELVLAALGGELNIPKSRQFVKIGSITQHILTTATEQNIDLIIVGTNSKKGIFEFLGGTASAIVNRAKCDILALRPGA